MAKYGDVAILAAKMLKEGVADDPRAAWSNAARSIFPTSTTSQIKSCPKSAFLGLCEEGLIIGASAGEYTRSKDNKAYALKALNLIRGDPNLVNDLRALWLMVLEEKEKSENSQMDVVISLWESGAINHEQLIQDAQ